MIRESIKAPYRDQHLPQARPTGVLGPEPIDDDVAKVIGFIWVTALVRFVFVMKRHEVFTADPMFAALITFGVPAVLLIIALVAALRHLKACVRAFFGSPSSSRA